MSNSVKILIAIAFLSLLTFSSCGDPESPKATVTVLNGMTDDVNGINVPLEGAIVTVFIDPRTGTPGYVDPDGDINKLVKNTDASGKCSFDFTLENILQVKVDYPLGNDTLYGEGVLVLKEDETYEEVIHLRKWKSQL